MLMLRLKTWFEVSNNLSVLEVSLPSQSSMRWFYLNILYLYFQYYLKSCSTLGLCWFSFIQNSVWALRVYYLKKKETKEQAETQPILHI